MSSDPQPRHARPAAPGEHCPPEGDDAAPDEAPLLYVRVLGLCRLLGEERFFRAAFGDAGVHPREAAVNERTRVLELDVEEVLRAALGPGAPANSAACEPERLSGR
ncbi:hypothetical protein [Sphaerisporangium dianthi]|uniref:Uncharacterized protein n=1 Tax=Sphaerisporangium dianthi TaxID=1436120 RepID=A0ABV9CCE6_9ACTN